MKPKREVGRETAQSGPLVKGILPIRPSDLWFHCRGHMSQFLIRRRCCAAATVKFNNCRGSWIGEAADKRASPGSSVQHEGACRSVRYRNIKRLCSAQEEPDGHQHGRGDVDDHIHAEGGDQLLQIIGVHVRVPGGRDRDDQGAETEQTGSG